MPAIFNDDDKRRHRFWNTAPPDPTKAARQGKGSYFRPGHNRVLMPDSFMPTGEHAGKTMRAVPLDFLLWVNAQLWAVNWDSWQPVADYISRFITADQDTPSSLPELPSPTFYLAPLSQSQSLKVSPSPLLKVCSALHCLPGHEDLLHAFAVGGLNLSRDWYQPGALPHYLLTKTRHDHALRLGAQSISTQQQSQHTSQWIDYYRSKPRFTELPTPARLPHQRLRS